MNARSTSLVLAGFLFASFKTAHAANKPDPATYTVKLHVSSAQYAAGPLLEILSVTIDGRHYQIEGPTSSAKVYGNGNGLLNLGDYPAKLVIDTHKTSYESNQAFQLLLPDGSVRTFSVILQSE